MTESGGGIRTPSWVQEKGPWLGTKPREVTGVSIGLLIAQITSHWQTQQTFVTPLKTLQTCLLYLKPMTDS